MKITKDIWIIPGDGSSLHLDGVVGDRTVIITVSSENGGEQSITLSMEDFTRAAREFESPDEHYGGF